MREMITGKILDDTIKKNIAIGLKDDEIDEQKLVECTKLSQIYNFIKMWG